MYEVELTDIALKELGKLEKNLQERIVKTLERIRIRPEPHLTKLVGDSTYRLRVGDYRLIIDINKNKLILLVIKIGHRKNVYDNY
ncbi:MAG TPA: type II toxin-antitoxin system RelE/ParE family toxin [Candidatus Nanoarchaeia archaeon]|nr:type II toxin-antitoxin system RelE/ParE family toxin [Candidatus Nanoarchaeia archaeon]